MSRRVDIVFDAVDKMAQAILSNQIPLNEKIFDPNSELFEYVTWPNTYLNYKKKIQEAEEKFEKEPLKEQQWYFIEKYLENQYGLKLC